MKSPSQPKWKKYWSYPLQECLLAFIPRYVRQDKKKYQWNILAILNTHILPSQAPHYGMIQWDLSGNLFWKDHPVWKYRFSISEYFLLPLESQQTQPGWKNHLSGKTIFFFDIRGSVSREVSLYTIWPLSKVHPGCSERWSLLTGGLCSELY